ncbi:uncharacterized protein LOC127624673 [Xyrauchen texanus]|uniref:uncharacterized protein LOC127624673 n=1 Tax=Xyrauchen texanus TaxID=154827 RepID=UPI002241BD03|nr:uncharacterized protein LOC127624673 [Xyrauchen texanus]
MNNNLKMMWTTLCKRTLIMKISSFPWVPVTLQILPVLHCCHQLCFVCSKGTNRLIYKTKNCTRTALCKMTMMREDFELFMSASDSESSDEDGYYDQADSFMEEDQLEDTDIFGEENMDADGFRVTEDSPEHLMLKLLAFMLLAWQAVFKISDRAIFALLRCIRQLIWLMGHILCVNTLCGLAGKIPKTLYSLRKWTNICRDSFSQFVPQLCS